MRSKIPPLNELGLLAQLVEQVTLNHRVGGSSPSQPTFEQQRDQGWLFDYLCERR